MKRIDTSTASEDENGSGKDGFTNGDPNAVPPVPATVVDDDWLNNVQEEICNAIEEQGIALNSGDKGQLSDAIRNPSSVTTGGIALNDSDTSTNSIVLKGVATSGANTGATISVNSARGTLASPTAVQSGDELGRIGFGGASANGTWSEEKGYISVTAAGNWSGSSMPANVDVFLAPSGSTTPARAFRILSNKTVEMEDATIADTLETNYLVVDRPSRLSFTNDLNRPIAISLMNNAHFSGTVTYNFPFSASNNVSDFSSIPPTLTIPASTTLRVTLPMTDDMEVTNISIIGKGGTLTMLAMITTYLSQMTDFGVDGKLLSNPTTSFSSNTLIGKTVKNLTTSSEGEIVTQSFSSDNGQFSTNGHTYVTIANTHASAAMTIVPFLFCRFNTPKLDPEGIR